MILSLHHNSEFISQLWIYISILSLCLSSEFISCNWLFFSSELWWKKQASILCIVQSAILINVTLLELTEYQFWHTACPLKLTLIVKVSARYAALSPQVRNNSVSLFIILNGTISFRSHFSSDVKLFALNRQWRFFPLRLAFNTTHNSPEESDSQYQSKLLS